MFSGKADGPLRVQIPSPAEDRPSWTKVAVLTAVGFLAGVAWPRLAGVRVGPSLPADVSNATASGSSAAADTQGVSIAQPQPQPQPQPPARNAVASAPSARASPSSAAPLAPASMAAPAVAAVATVGHAVVFACKTSEGDALQGDDCGALPGLNGVVMPRLRKLADCPGAQGQSGKLHLVLHVDFGRGAISVNLGKGQGVASPEPLLACARTDMADASLAGIAHDNPRYSVAYAVTFGSGIGAATSAAPASTEPPPGAAAGPNAQVVWEVAIIRDVPKTGRVVARLQRGAAVRLGAAKDGWYPVQFGDGFGSEGWVYRGAVGR